LGEGKGGFLFSRIKKRDGRVVKFDINKIVEAIRKAGEATGEFKEATARRLAIKVVSFAKQLYKNKLPNVEDIQDIVEEILLSSAYKVTAKAYIIYRQQHAEIRRIQEEGSVNLVDQYLEKIDWQVKENSNMSFSLQGLNNYISSEISKTYWLNKIYPPEIRKPYLNGDLHIHDLNLLSAYCVGWDLFDLLNKGFTGVESKTQSKPAKHLRTALGQIVNFFYTTQGETAGAQAFSNFDTLLAPYIYYDKLDYAGVKQALQEFIFNVNVPTRVGFQTPFTNVTLDLTVPKYYANNNVAIGGEIKRKKYSQFQKEIDLFNKAFFEVMREGDARGRVFSFPIPTYNITKDFDWDNPVIKDLWNVSAKYGIPYFSNFINSDMDPSDARSMCCRLRIDNRKLEKKHGGLFGAAPLTGSIGVVTINLPRIGYLSKNKPEFESRLLSLMEIARDSLEIKRKIIERFMDGNLYPYSKFYLSNVKKRFGFYWKNHFSTIGLIGMHEACLNFLGKGIETQEGKEFAAEILDLMREKLIEFQKETGNNYNLEATPAEGTGYRMAINDKKKYPKIIVANEDQYQNGAEPYYTNSSQLPVDFTEDVFEALDHQDLLQTKYTGGTVLHLFLGEQIKDPNTIKKLTKYICENYNLPYFTFSPTFSICPNHGYISGEVAKCPICKAPCESYSRVVGYLTPISHWNNGKKEEFHNRKTFQIQNQTKKQENKSKNKRSNYQIASKKNRSKKVLK